MTSKMKHIAGRKSYPAFDRSQPQSAYSQRLRTNYTPVNRYDGISRPSGQQFFVMYGLTDKKAFTDHISNKNAFERGAHISTLEERMSWTVGDVVHVNYGGHDVECKLAAICATDVEAGAEVQKLIEKFTKESIYGSDYNADDAIDQQQRETPRGSGDDSDRDSNDDGDDSSHNSDESSNSIQRMAKRHKTDFDHRRNFEMQRLTQARMHRMQADSDNNDDTLSKILEIVQENQNMLQQMKHQLERQEKNHDKDMRAIWRSIRKLGKRANLPLDSSAISEQGVARENDVCNFFTPEDNLTWMGSDASSYFNESLAKYNGDLNKFMHRLALEMWGDWICYYFLIPAGDRSKSSAQRRQLLELKDPSGVKCLKKVLDKILIAQERARLELANVADVESKLQSYERKSLALDRQKQLSSIGQLGLDFKNNRTHLVPKAHYYILIENGSIPTANWTVLSETYADNFYRDRNNSVTVKEESIILEVAHQLNDALGNEEVTDRLVAEYKAKYPFLKL